MPDTCVTMWRTTKQKPDPCLVQQLNSLCLGWAFACTQRQKVPNEGVWLCSQCATGAVWGYRWCKGPLRELPPTHRHGTSTWCLPSTQLTTCSIRRPLLEGKERATWLRGQGEGVKNKRGHWFMKTSLVQFPYPGRQHEEAWHQSRRRPGSPAGSEGFVVLGWFAVGFPQHLGGSDHTVYSWSEGDINSWVDPKYQKQAISSRALRLPWWSSG